MRITATVPILPGAANQERAYVSCWPSP